MRRHPAFWSVRELVRSLCLAAAAFAVLTVCESALPAANKGKQPQFKYAGGTEEVSAACPGFLQLESESMIYRCPPYSVTIPYNAIESMQYRADVPRRVRKLKLRWKMIPPMGGGHENRYFSVVFRLSGTLHAVVLEVPNEEMRPYMAEIDLKAGRRVDVQRHEDYE